MLWQAYKRDGLHLERSSLDVVTTLVKIGMNYRMMLLTIFTSDPLEIFCMSVLHSGIWVSKKVYFLI